MLIYAPIGICSPSLIQNTKVNIIRFLQENTSKCLSNVITSLLISTSNAVRGSSPPDAGWVVRLLAARGLEVALTQDYGRAFGLYGEML